jgi:hypothetical protein
MPCEADIAISLPVDSVETDMTGASLADFFGRLDLADAWLTTSFEGFL